MNNYKLISIPKSLHRYIAWLIKAEGLGLGAEESLERELERMCIRQYSSKFAPQIYRSSVRGISSFRPIQQEESYTLQRITVDDKKGSYLSLDPWIRWPEPRTSRFWKPRALLAYEIGFIDHAELTAEWVRHGGKKFEDSPPKPITTERRFSPHDEEEHQATEKMEISSEVKFLEFSETRPRGRLEWIKRGHIHIPNYELNIKSLLLTWLR